MHQFQFCREMFVNIDPCPPKKVELLVKLLKAGSSLVKNLGGRNQADFKAAFVDTDAVLDVFAQTGEDKASYLFPNFS